LGAKSVNLWFITAAKIALIWRHQFRVYTRPNHHN
jgi:hypothetical protein